ncbi:MAG: hypothetical protein ACMUIS_06755 [bacterium]
MKKTSHSWRDEVRITELIEQSLYLVRTSLPACGWIYYLCTIPFVVGFMRFWSIMSGKAIGPFEVSRWALLLTLLFWIKVTGQGLYCKVLLSRLTDEATGTSLTQGANSAVNAIFVHPVALILLLVCLPFILPLGYAVMYSQYLYLTSGERGAGIYRTMKRAYRSALQEGLYQHLVLLFLAGLYVVIIGNVLASFFIFPHLLKVLLGIETVFTRATFSMVNTTFLMIVACTSYLIVDPLLKGVYVTLFFHMKSRSSGDDILAEKRRLSEKRGIKRGIVAALLVLSLVCPLSPPLHAAENHEKTEAAQEQESEAETLREQLRELKRAEEGSSVDYTWLDDLIEKEGIGKDDVAYARERLDFIRHYREKGIQRDNAWIDRLSRTIADVSRQERYRWRYREKRVTQDKEEGFIVRMIWDLLRTLGRWLKPVARFIEKVLIKVAKFLRKLLFSRKWEFNEPTDTYWSDLWPALVIIITVIIFLIGIIYLFWQHHKDRVTVIQGKKRGVPDLTKEEVDATELEEDEWIRLGNELKEKGELTLALRSAFLAVLSFFHRNGYLVFERYKTNYNYLSELGGNTRNNASMTEGFRACIEIFERAWYGKYPVTPDILERFEGHRRGIMEGT